MEPKVYIRTDGGPEIGLGHLVRCMSLAQMLAKEFEINFVCKKIPEYTVSEIKKLGFFVTIIEEEGDFLTQLKSDSIVVLDHYGLDSDYQKTIKDKGCKLVCIDDLHDKVFFADLIINHAPNVKISDYKAQAYTKFALGLEYVLLRPAFLEEAKKERVIGNSGTVFICFGGSDFENLTTKVVKSVLPESKFKKIIVVTGPSFKYRKDLVKAIKNDMRVQYEHSIDGNRMFELMKISDWAIVPASGILFEVIAVGVKPLICYFADNQKEFHDYLVENCNFLSLGYLSKGDVSISNFSLLATEDERRNESFNSLRSEISMAKENCVRSFKNIL
ncbi:MAG: UDP-2,4-diacetamido-2,4,6-trideoxy-beta-L-altropyranose hydrolase [Bacteroidota bacterium]